ALLRLQARRTRAQEAREALEEAVRRVGSIAIVHETLSHTPEELVDFDDIACRVAAMAGEGSAAESQVSPGVAGRFGLLPRAVARGPSPRRARGASPNGCKPPCSRAWSTCPAGGPPVRSW